MLKFVEELGVTDALTEIQTPRLESSIRKYLERTVPRQMLILDPIKVVVEDMAPEDEQEITVPYDPKGSIPGERKVKLSKEVYIDRSDFREVDDDPEYRRLAPGKVVGLYNVPFPIRATSFSKDESTGKVTEIKAVKAEWTTEKTKAHIQWVDAATGMSKRFTEATQQLTFHAGITVTARQYNSLFKTDSPNSLDWKTGGWADDLRPDSEIVYSNAVIERGLKDLVKERSLSPSGSSDALVRFQALRVAYFCVDVDSTEDNIVLNQIVSLREDKGK
jgi:glutaminyl-tRNA synthetase